MMFGRTLNVLWRWVPPPLPNVDTLELQALPDDEEEDLIGSLHDKPSWSAQARAKTATPLRIVKSTAGRFLGSRSVGWRFGALNFAALALVVFVLNLVVTIWGRVTENSGRGVYYEGDCVRVKRFNTGLHVLINILSTVLLSGSNYCMQAMSAPTAHEVDRAHAKGKWLDIGVPGIRNVRHISRRRVILWSLLGLTSLPLHLFYNSAVYASISSNSYEAYSVSQSFIEDTECRYCAESSTIPKRIMVLTYLWEQARNGTLDRLEPAACLDQYAQIIQSNRRNLLLVASDTHFPSLEKNVSMNGSHVYLSGWFSASAVRGTDTAADAYGWICSAISSGSSEEPCSRRVGSIKSNPETWRVGELDWPVEYCLSEKAEPHCKLHFEPTVAIVVTALNLVKVLLMLFVAFGVREDPLMTMGDAVASFLKSKSPATKNMCLVSIKDLKKRENKNYYRAGARQWVNKQYRWKDVTSVRRRLVTLLMFLLALAIVSSLLHLGLSSIKDKTIMSQLAFGASDPRTAIVGMPNEILVNTIVANSPQLILSFLYFSYNSLFTAMLMGYEWTSYAFKRKGLRVSAHPVGAQRSTYFLQLPYRFGLPLITLSTTMHWLVSQSIFLISIDYYDKYGNPYNRKLDKFSEKNDLKTLGFSPSAIISVIVMGSLMVISIVAFGFVPYKRGMPLVGSCSLAISATCHNKEDGAKAAEGELQWGVVGVDVDGIGHCTFSTDEVKAPVEGEMYA